MTDFQPRNPDYKAEARESFSRQAMMREMGMEIDAVAPGEVTLSMPFDRRFTQQHGYLHAAATTAGLDTACGFAAFTLMPKGRGVLTVELKTSLFAPGEGGQFRFVGRVLKPGRTLFFTEGEAYAASGGAQRLIATLTATMMCVEGRAEATG